MSDGKHEKPQRRETWMDFLRELVPNWDDEKQPEFEGILADQEAVERAFGDDVHYESQGGYGE